MPSLARNFLTQLRQLSQKFLEAAALQQRQEFLKAAALQQRQ